MKDFDYTIIEYLKKISTKSSVTHRHAAGLLLNDKLISSGINKFIFINECSFNKTLHAEIAALSCISKKNTRGLDLVVIRNKNNNLQNSRPCSACIDKLQKAGIRKVYFSDENGEIVHEVVENMEKTHISSNSRNS